ncbi:diaminopimelate epimerase [Tessaracoccus lapidicaptus]|uniref:diaminopimelate epimerase n=1 Tax=Tessaracoccus lapidicaptus TaxID=1427523 RepID=UPI00333F1FB6
MRRFSFHKGHGTRNDFIILDDSYGMHDMHPEFIQAVCDRHAGIGADGVIRVVRAGSIRDWTGDPHLWFMDYYNADGSVAEMCGNGLRVFARHLINEQLVDAGAFDVATRAGVKHVEVARHGLISTDIGRALVLPDDVTVTLEDRSWPAVKVDVGNPHAVVFLTDSDVLEDLDLHRAPRWSPAEAYPQGVNVEFVRVDAPDALTMRVHERGVGETMSCGTGVVAVAAAHRARGGHEGPVTVRVPGGELSVQFTGDEARLTGPAVVIGRGEFWI